MTTTAVAGPSDRRLAEFALAAREMAKPVDVERTLAVVVERAQAAFLCQAVGVLLIENGRVATAAASGPLVERADELQMSTAQGPCIEAIQRRRNFIVDDLRTDSRWPVWAPQAADLGYNSILSIGLTDEDRTFGALNLYSGERAFFSDEDLSLGEVFAAHAAIALAGTRERDSLLKAVEARHLIGQAQGILMERYDVDAEQAFTVLRRYSSHTNRKLRQVAEEIVRSRRLPSV